MKRIEELVAERPRCSGIATSHDRVEQYTKQVLEMGVEIVDSIPALRRRRDIELLTFMQAADEGKRHGGAPVELWAVLEQARGQAKTKLAAM